MKKSILVILICLNNFAYSQNGIGYFININNDFVAFEKGNTYVLERTKVDSIHVGDNYLAYVNAIADLKIFYNGETKVLESAYPTYIAAMANALVYKMQQRLMIVESGQKKELSKWAENIITHEEIVVWQDWPSMNLMAYSNGKIDTVEKAFEFKTIKEYKIGRNIFVYNDLNNHLKIFWNGKVYDSQTSNILDFKCAKNTAAYYDPFYNEFKVFQNGVFTTISTFAPKEYQVGDNMVVYLDINEYFYVYYKGESKKLLSYKPNSYTVTNNLVLFYDFGEMGKGNAARAFDVFYEGEVYLLEKFIPNKKALTGFHSLLYYDNNGRLKYFFKGKMYENFLIEKPFFTAIHRDLPHFQYGNYVDGFLYEGKLYDYSGRKKGNTH